MSRAKYFEPFNHLYLDYVFGISMLRAKQFSPQLAKSDLDDLGRVDLKAFGH